MGSRRYPRDHGPSPRPTVASYVGCARDTRQIGFCRESLLPAIAAILVGCQLPERPLGHDWRLPSASAPAMLERMGVIRRC